MNDIRYLKIKLEEIDNKISGAYLIIDKCVKPNTPEFTDAMTCINKLLNEYADIKFEIDKLEKEPKETYILTKGDKKQIELTDIELTQVASLIDSVPDKATVFDKDFAEKIWEFVKEW